MSPQEAIAHYEKQADGARRTLYRLLFQADLSSDFIDEALGYLKTAENANRKRGIAEATDRMHNLFAFECEAGR